MHHPWYQPVRDVVHQDAEAFDRAHVEEDEIPGLREDDLVVRLVALGAHDPPTSRVTICPAAMRNARFRRGTMPMPVSSSRGSQLSSAPASMRASIGGVLRFSFFGFRTTTDTWNVFTREAYAMATRSTRRRRYLGSECGSRFDSARPYRRAECPCGRRALAPDQVAEGSDAAECEGEDHVGHAPDAPPGRVLPHPERDETQRDREIHERGHGGGVGQHEPKEADVAVLVDDVGIERREPDQHDGQSQLLRVHGSLLGVWLVHSSRSGPISASGRSSGKKSFASGTSIRRVTPGIVSRSQRAQRTSKKTSASPHTTSVGTRSRRSAGSIATVCAQSNDSQ